MLFALKLKADRKLDSKVSEQISRLLHNDI
jgi:hypothetical protein